MIEVERVGEQRDCKHCSRTYGTLGCCSTVSNKWVYSCEEGHREYEETHKHMTIPEAIEVLAQDLPCETDEDLSEAMTMAIKVLEQQPCEDAVSRQAVHGLIAELLSDYLHDEDREKIEELDVKIEGLPSVTPKEKTGKWIGIKNSKETVIALRCSHCGNSPKRAISSDFCPNCGARMVSE